MLQLKKNKIVTNVSEGQVEIRQMEVDWYCGNYQTISGQAAMLAGFAFNFITAPMPEEKQNATLELIYFFCVCAAMGAELGVIVISSSLSVWAPSLALRGKRGATDLHKACDTLRDYQTLVFSCFMCGWVIYFVASILQVWVFYRKSIAMFVSIPFCLFTLAIVWYLLDLRWKLSLPEDQAASKQFGQFSKRWSVERLRTLNAMNPLVTSLMGPNKFGRQTAVLRRRGSSMRAAGGEAGDYFAVGQDEDEPKILVSGRSTQRSK